MVEVFLFLGSIILFFFLPVHIQVFYRKQTGENLLVLQMWYLKGLISIRREEDFTNIPLESDARVRFTRRWFWWRSVKKEMRRPQRSVEENSRQWREFFERFQNYGPGITLLSYLIPIHYQRWLFVYEDLERRGSVERFRWLTRFGIGNAAQTAVLYGVLWGIKSGVVGFLRRRYRFRNAPEIKVITDYQNTGLDLVVDCIFRVRLGYIIIAAFMAHLRHVWIQRLVKR